MVNFLALLGVMFIYFKMTGAIDWSWMIVLIPVFILIIGENK